MEERLQKIMAQSGLGSRRDCEVLIISGRVSVNGVVAVIGQKADAQKDKISVDGKLLKAPEQKVYIALNKPRMVLSAVESEKSDTRKTVRDLIPLGERLYPVGRLDFDSEGLVLMTNDGDLAQRLTHPSYEHEKEYRVLVASQPDEDQLGTWRRGVVLEDGYKTMPAEVKIEGAAGKGCWLRIIMREGRKRQIREIGSLIGLPVVRIVRIRIGALHLGALKLGEWRYLSPEEIAALKGDAPETTRLRPISRNGRRGSTHRPSGPHSQRSDGSHYERPEGSSSDRPARSQSRRPAGSYAEKTAESTSDRSSGPSSRRPAGTQSEHPAESTYDRPARPKSRHPGRSYSDQRAGSTSERPARPASRRPAGSYSDQSAGSTSERPARSQSRRPTGSYSDQPAGSTSDRPSRPASRRPAGNRSERPAGSPSGRPARPSSGRPAGSQSERPPRRTRPVSNRSKK